MAELKPSQIPSKPKVEKIVPVLITDTREQAPLVFRFASEVGTVAVGDYTLKGAEHLFTVERKSIADLVGCVAQDRARFEAQLRRMRGYRFARLLIIGSRLDVERHNYRSSVTPQSILGTLNAFEVRYCPVAWADTPEAGARLIERWAFYFIREILKDAKSVIDSHASEHAAPEALHSWTE